VTRLTNGRGLQTLRGLSNQVVKVLYSDDGRLLAALSHGWQVGIWKMPSGRLLRILDVPPGEDADNAGMAFSPDGKRFAFSAGRRASLWEIGSGKQITFWPLHIGFVDHIGFDSVEDKLVLFRVESDRPDIPPWGIEGRHRPKLCWIRHLMIGKEPEP